MWEGKSKEEREEAERHKEELNKQREMDDRRKRETKRKESEAFARAEAEGRPCYENMSVEQLIPEARRRGVKIVGDREKLAERYHSPLTTML